MQINSVIIEQVDEDKSIKTVQLHSNKGRLTIAFADEYEDEREGPFYFQNSLHEKEFQRQINIERPRRLGQKYYRIDGNTHKLSIIYRGIPTARNELTYYALSLPKFALPLQIDLINPHAKSQLRKSVIKDEQRERYIIYVQCSSKHGIFNFDLECFFEINRSKFNSIHYRDNFNIDPYTNYDEWSLHVTDNEKQMINYYLGEVHMGDTYNVQQAVAVGKHARAGKNTLIQINNGQTINEAELIDALAKLRLELSNYKEPEQLIEAGIIAQAEVAAREGNVDKAKGLLKTVGSWTYDIATKLGISLIVDLIRPV
jgi:hypothetical protein